MKIVMFLKNMSRSILVGKYINNINEFHLLSFSICRLWSKEGQEYQAHPWPMYTILLSILLEHEKQIDGFLSIRKEGETGN